MKTKYQLEMELEEEKVKTKTQPHQIQTLHIQRQELWIRNVGQEDQDHYCNSESENGTQQTIKSLLHDLKLIQL